MVKDKSIESSVPTEVTPPRMVYIPEGAFLMGTSNKQIMHLVEVEDWAEEWQEKGLFRIEQPQYKINVPGFSICATPVTNAEYNLFVWETNYRAPRQWGGFRFPEGLGDHPVVGVAKPDAEAYCQWLSEQLGDEYRLPNEIEWEKAARGEDGRMYPWGNEFDPWRCNTLESGRKSTTPVGNYSPGGDSIYGISDMVGNVFEWTSSYLRQYPYKSNQDAVEDGGDKTLRCVVRGGAWYYSRKLGRCAAREGAIPSFVSPALGFRVASSQAKFNEKTKTDES
ncbi:MAG TPA: SUMF1/EgtB/PvdO family nonheme iron enzyme [Anaerolineaceae bacterium]